MAPPTTCLGLRHDKVAGLYHKAAGGTVTLKYIFNWVRIHAMAAGVSFPQSLCHLQKQDSSAYEYLQSLVSVADG